MVVERHQAPIRFGNIGRNSHHNQRNKCKKPIGAPITSGSHILEAQTIYGEQCSLKVSELGPILPNLTKLEGFLCKNN